MSQGKQSTLLLKLPLFDGFAISVQTSQVYPLGYTIQMSVQRGQQRLTQTFISCAW